MVVQNMLLVGAAHNVGAYWSSESVVDGNVKLDENVALPANSIATAFNPAYASSKAAQCPSDRTTGPQLVYIYTYIYMYMLC